MIQSKIPNPLPPNKQNHKPSRTLIILIKQKAGRHLSILRCENRSRWWLTKRPGWRPGGGAGCLSTSGLQRAVAPDTARSPGASQGKLSMGQIRPSWHLSHYNLATIILLIISFPPASSPAVLVNKRKPILYYGKISAILFIQFSGTWDTLPSYFVFQWPPHSKMLSSS